MSSIHVPEELISLPCFAVKVRTRGEELVAGLLRQKGLQVLSPMFIELRKYSDRTCRVASSLFPGYLFVRMDIRKRVQLLSTDGVSYIIRSGAGLEPLSEQETRAVEALCRDGVSCEPCSYLRVGQRVRIESGAFTGVEGVLVRVHDVRRLVISVDALCSSVSVEVGANRIRLLDNEERVVAHFRGAVSRPGTSRTAVLSF